MTFLYILLIFVICSLGTIAIMGEEKLMIASEQKEMRGYWRRVFSGAFIFSVIALWTTPLEFITW